jgi:hypothetical protein
LVPRAEGVRRNVGCKNVDVAGHRRGDDVDAAVAVEVIDEDLRVRVVGDVFFNKTVC